MGYDAGPLRCLRGAMQRADTELGAIPTAESDTGEAMRAIRSARETIGGKWLTLIDSVLACRTMPSYAPVRIGLDDLVNARFGVLQQLYGWSVTRDPLQPVGAGLSLDQAQSMGWLLSQGNIEDLVSSQEIAYLDNMLAAIARSPALSAAFLANMTSVGWTNLCNRLGDDRVGLMADLTVAGKLVDGDRDGPANIDSIFASLGMIATIDRSVAANTESMVQLDEINPYAAAMLVRSLGLAAEELASLSMKLIARYREGGWADVQRPGPGTGDILMQAMLATPGAPTAFVLLARHDPATIFDAAHDDDLAAELLLQATSPSNMTIAQAGTVIPLLTRYMAASYPTDVGFYGRPNDRIDLLTVDLVAPWLLQFSTTHASDWHLEPGEGARLLADVITDNTAFARLMDVRAKIVEGMTKQIADSRDPSRRAVQDLAAMLALIDTLCRQRTISTIADARALWDTGFAVVGAATSFLPGGAATGLGTGLAINQLQSVLASSSLAPPGAQTVAHDTLYVLDWQTTVAAAAVVSLMFDHMMTDGRIDKNAPLPPLPSRGSPTPGAKYSADFSAWLDRAHLGAAGLAIELAKQTIASAHESERNAAELATG